VTSLLQELQALEVELHHPGARCSRERLEQLLHPAFHEVGRSGRRYSRDTVVSHLSSQSSHPKVVSDGFALAELGAEFALLTYRSSHEEPGGGLISHSLRSSIWTKSRSGWQLLYHQGTPAAQTS
jgi:hypothetical protein